MNEEGMGASEASFYGRGLRFECTRCSACCRHTPGYVFLSEADVERLCRFLGRERERLLYENCRQVSLGIAKRTSLIEKPNLDCIFWENGGCSVYPARPLQCRSFPFWSSSLASREQWEGFALQCPGIGKGRLHTRRRIERWLRLRVQEGFIES